MILESVDTACDRFVESGERDLAAEARFILSALDAAARPVTDRRRGSRLRYRVEATLHLCVDGPEEAPHRVYTRDLSPHGLGFISPVPLALGSAARVYLPTTGGRAGSIDGNVIRCREMVHGWFDCAVTFREETDFG